MRKALLKYGAVSAVVVTGLAIVAPALAAPMTTSTLGENIDTLSGQTQDYFSTLITHFWPFLLGALLLVGIIGFAIGIIMRIWGKR